METESQTQTENSNQNPNPNPKRPWHEGDIARLVQWWAEGVSSAEMARRLQRTPGAVEWRASQLRAAGYDLPDRRKVTINGTKLCRGCQRTLPLSEYYASSTSFSGRKSRCKECVRAKARQWWYDHPERRNDPKQKQWRRDTTKRWAARKRAERAAQIAAANSSSSSSSVQG